LQLAVVGQKSMLQVTIAWFAGFTFLQGLSAGFAWLLVARSLQGLGFGGEWAAGSVLAAETIRSKHRGKAVGAVQSSWSVGWGIAALLATLFFQVMPRDYAWRVLFFVGILPALFIFLSGVQFRNKIFIVSKGGPNRVAIPWRFLAEPLSAAPHWAHCWRWERRVATMRSPPGYPHFCRQREA
jgi:MFS family permease